NDEHIHEEEHNHAHDHQHDHAHDGHDHATHEHDHDNIHEHIAHDDELVAEKPQNNAFIKSIGQDMIEDHGVEITALLVKYSSPTAISVLPRMINQSTQMQAASPAIESSRIFSLLGVGF